MKSGLVALVATALLPAMAVAQTSTADIAPRTELHAIPSMTVSDSDFLAGKDGKAVTVAGHAANGGNLEGAMFKARGLPRGGPVRQRFERHLRAWPLGRLSSALQVILRAEQECKSTGYPDEAIARRLCLALASSARSARQRR